MLSNQAIKKNKYTRPAYAKNYLQLSDVLLSEESHQREMILEVPPINNILPTFGWNHYAEATSEGVAVEGRVVCSGSIIPIYNAAGTSVIGIGISKYDAKPGDRVACIVEGDVLMPFAADNSTTEYPNLSGTAAYISNTFITTSTSTSNVRIGEFLGAGKIYPRAGMIPHYGNDGSVWIPVRLSQNPETSFAKPAANAFTGFDKNNGGNVVINALISDFVGLDQNIYLTLKAFEPDNPVLPQDVHILYGGNKFPANSDFTIPVTFTAGVGETFEIIWEKDDFFGPTVAELTVDISASAAPANFGSV